MTLLTLPAALSGAIPSIRWPLGPSSCPPLYFEPLDGMKLIREKSLQSTPLLDTILDDPPFPTDDSSPESRHFGIISTALLCLGHGLTDEAHDLVTPLSWPEDTHFGYKSVYSQATSSVRAYASYVHCLVHRREAFNIGEFGMMGFANANYWSNAVMKSPGVNSLPHLDLVREIGQIAREYNEIPSVKEWSESHGMLIEHQIDEEPFFESRAVHELCANVLREASNPELQAFAERVAETEVRVLLAYALQNAGYDCPLSMALQRHDGSAPTPKLGAEVIPSVDENTALSAARRVSSAHLNMFQTGGSVIIRKVVGDGDCGSAAAGVVCRLLESPACRVTSPMTKTQKSVHILLPATQEEAEAISTGQRMSEDSDYLSQGDLYVVRQVNSDCLASGPWLCFVACDAADKRACFVDRLYGTRGETPTTVVQWSKGTIF